MEIPVRMMKVQKKVEQEEKKLWVTRSRNNSFCLEQEKQTEKFETKKQYTPIRCSPKLNKWVHLMELEKETEMLHQQQALLHFNNVLERVHVQLNPVERVMLFHIRDTTFKRYITLPQFVNVHKVKVQYCVERKLVIIKAPRMPTYYSCKPTSCTEEKMQMQEEQCRRQMCLWSNNKYNLINIPVLMKEEQKCECKEQCTFTCIKPRTTDYTKWCCEEPTRHMSEQYFRRTIQLEREVFEQCLIQHRQMQHVIITKVCPILRVVIVKMQPIQSTFVPFKRIFRVPSWVNMELIKVELCQERCAILIKAPFQQQFFNTMQQSEQELFHRRCELEMLEKEPEYELNMYKMLKNLRRQCPVNTVILPRFIRSRKTGEHVLHLDVECTRFNPEHLLVKTKECVKVLTIRHQNKDTDFFHQFTLPTVCNMERMRTTIVNKRTLRIKLPFTPRTPLRMF